MDISLLKSKLPPVFSRVCREIQVHDAIIDWIDIIFEQIGSASKCPPHFHAWFEFNYVLSGEMMTGFNGSLVPIREGDFFLIPPGMVHSHSYTRGNPHEGICIRWRIRSADMEGASHSLYERLNKLNEWKPGCYRDQYGIKQLLVNFFDEALIGSSSELSLQLTLVKILEVLTRIRTRDEPSPARQANEVDQLLKKVEIYLQDFQGIRLNVSVLAASLHMSYGHLSRLYKKRTGITIIERMNEIRLEKAQVLLEQSDLMIREVAEQSGFADLCYFSKAFKKKYGVSPLAYKLSRLQ